MEDCFFQLQRAVGNILYKQNISLRIVFTGPCFYFIFYTIKQNSNFFMISR